MTANNSIERYFARSPGAAALGYFLILVAFLLTIAFAIWNIADQFRALDRSVDILARLEERPHSLSLGHSATEGTMTPGSPFLQGPTPTVASAALLQRVLGAITRVGGNVESSEVVQQDTQAHDGYLKVNVTCELKQEDLQPLLYDLEAGMPFLFVNQFVVDVAPSGSERNSMHVLLEISGLWPGAK